MVVDLLVVILFCAIISQLVPNRFSVALLCLSFALCLGFFLSSGVATEFLLGLCGLLWLSLQVVAKSGDRR